MSIRVTRIANSIPAPVDAFYLASYDVKNRFIDIELNKSVYGNSINSIPIDTTSISLAFEDNGGDVSTVDVISIKQPDSKVEAEATALVGGENLFRVFIDPDTYPSGDETVEITLVPENCWTVAGVKASGTTGELAMSPLPFAVIGNDFIWWDAEETAYTEGIEDRGLHKYGGVYEAGYEGVIGSDVDGTYIDTTGDASAEFDGTFSLSVNDEEYLFFIKHKYNGDINTPTEQGNFFDMDNERTIPCYPFGTNDEWGCIFTGSGNSNLQSSGSPGLTNNTEILHYKLQTGTLEMFKDNVSVDTAGAYAPYRWTGNGRLFSNKDTPTSQNYNGYVYHILVIKGSYKNDEIIVLYNFMNNL